MKLKRNPYHPFLFAILPIIALLGNNISEQSLDAVIRPIILSLAVCLIVFAVLRLVLRDLLKASLVTTLCLLLFFTYGQVANILKASTPGLAWLVENSLLILIYTGLLMLGLFLILRGGRPGLPIANQTLNMIGIVLVVFPLFQIGVYTRSMSYTLAKSAKLSPRTTLDNPPASRPDVYYIILDGYSRADVIQKELRFDNTPFVDQLSQMGFEIGDCSRSNYSATHTSINSSLNMEQLPTLRAWAVDQGFSADKATTFIKTSQVSKLFKSMGYQTIAFDSGFEATRLRDADQYLSSAASPYSWQSLTSFEAMLLDRTLASVLTKRQTRAYPEKSAELAYRDSDAEKQGLFTFNELPKIAEIKAPTFTFAHILVPGTPSLISDGKRTNSGAVGGSKEAINTVDFRDAYVQDIQFVNQQTLPMIQKILTRSATPPIIVIQGSHGFGDTKFPILNAYYLPGVGKEKVYSSITPVNTFRMIFDAYLGGTYGLLPDESFSGIGNEAAVPELVPACK